jgi:hypothetical protein
MLGKVMQLKYVDHDIIDMMKFLELVPHYYLELRIYPTTNQNIHVPKVWARGLERASILNLFDIPHFSRRNEVNGCIKFLLTCVHGGYLWLGMPISINTDMIARITGLPSQGEDPTLLFIDKKRNKNLSEAMR